MKRHAAAAAACELIPLPLVDTIAGNEIRRSLVRRISDERGLDLTAEEVAELADEKLDTAGRVMRAIVRWPIKKLFSVVFFVYGGWRMVRAARQTMALADAESLNRRIEEVVN